MTMPNEQRLTLTVAEAAKALGLNRASAYAAVMRGEIPSLRFGKRILIPKTAFYQMLEGKPAT